MDNENLIVEMKKYNDQLKEIYKTNPNLAKAIARNSLLQMEYIDQNKNVIPPYNGKKVNEDDFMYGPGEIQYIKRRIKNGRRY